MDAARVGGVFDRHPSLRVAFVESGIGWIPKMLHDADMVYNSHVPVFGSKLFTGQAGIGSIIAMPLCDRSAGPEQLPSHRGGPVMWSSDYPHSEGTFGYSRDAIEAVFKATSVGTPRKSWARRQWNCSA